jgi:hypothetical protein
VNCFAQKVGATKALTLQRGHLNTRVWGYRREYFLTGLLNFAVNYIIIHNF